MLQLNAYIGAIFELNDSGIIAVIDVAKAVDIPLPVKTPEKTPATKVAKAGAKASAAKSSIRLLFITWSIIFGLLSAITTSL